MATILQFRRAECMGEALPVLRPATGRSAEVIIFPGVRIERPLEQHGEGSRPEPGPRRPAQGN